MTGTVRGADGIERCPLGDAPDDMRQRILEAQDDIRVAERVVRLRPDPRWKDADLDGAAEPDAIECAEAYGVGPAARRLLEIIT